MANPTHSCGPTVSADPALVEHLRDARKVLVFTGAGISTPSGIPDFRGPDGVWQTRRPVYYQEFMTSEVARLEYWDYKLEGWENFRRAEPNAVHRAVVDLERAGRVAMVVTQNVDGLHGKAGTSPDKLVELHGTNAAVECQRCGERSEPQAHFERFRAERRPPQCQCGGWLKPATISFGQALRTDDLDRAIAAAEQVDLVIALGSTLGVYPAAGIPLAAAERGVPYVVVNRGATDQDHLSAITLRLDGDVVELFPPAVAAALAAP